MSPQPVSRQQSTSQPHSPSVDYSKVRPTTVSVNDKTIKDHLSDIAKERSVSSAESSRPLTDIYGKAAIVPIDEVRLNDVWLRFARSIAEGDMQLSAIMTSSRPIVDGCRVKFSVANKYQLTTLLQATELLEFLRVQLKSPMLVIEPYVNEVVQQESGVVVYTSKQKLDSMLEDNDAIKLLVDKFSLDVVF